VSNLNYDPFSADTQQDPYPAYHQMLAGEPVYHNAERDFWALSRIEDVDEAARDWRRFSSAAGVRVDDLLALAGPSFITMDPPRHGVLRSLVRKDLQPRTLARLGPVIEDNARQILAQICWDDEVDLAGQFAKKLPVMVICELMGLPHRDGPTLKAWADDMLQSADGASTSAAVAASDSLRAYFSEQLERRRSHPSDDLLGRLVSVDLPEPLTPGEEIGMCNLLFEAGNSTTTSLIGNGLLALGTNPQQRSWLAARPDAMPQAVEELLRYDSPVQNQVRVTTAPVELHGAVIPAGATVMLVLGAANRDPRVWADPDELRLDREEQRNLAFGTGIHHCIGAPLARMEGRIALRLVLTVMPDFEVIQAERFPDVTLRMLRRLYVRPGPRPNLGTTLGPEAG
jgi:cytochrome P450